MAVDPFLNAGSISSGTSLSRMGTGSKIPPNVALDSSDSEDDGEKREKEKEKDRGKERDREREKEKDREREREKEKERERMSKETLPSPKAVKNAHTPFSTSSSISRSASAMTSPPGIGTGTATAAGSVRDAGNAHGETGSGELAHQIRIMNTPLKSFYKYPFSRSYEFPFLWSPPFLLVQSLRLDITSHQITTRHRYFYVITSNSFDSTLLNSIHIIRAYITLLHFTS